VAIQLLADVAGDLMIVPGHIGVIRHGVVS
jgi:hypothetical protein